ncbi:MAG: D-alanyl-D-alanine dipeptidase [Thermoproteota archaeon]|jgi:D-alanyl-D-alanine dipeptidase
MKLENFISLKKISSTTQVIASYATTHNFIGEIIPGYNAVNAYLEERAFNALKLAESKFNQKGLSLVIYDAYRPAKAVRFLQAWKDSPCEKMKSEFFPNLSKKEIFEQSFIAKKSSHSRGSTVDLSLFKLSTGKTLEMGTIFDCFSPESATNSKKISEQASCNRQQLLSIMEECGFVNYDKEWWHFRFEDEVHLNEYFDFDVE